MVRLSAKQYNCLTYIHDFNFVHHMQKIQVVPTVLFVCSLQFYMEKALVLDSHNAAQSFEYHLGQNHYYHKKCGQKCY